MSASDPPIGEMMSSGKDNGEREFHKKRTALSLFLSPFML